jgi:hypothetical protein
MVAGDDARFFKPMDALGDCGRGEANLSADFRKGLTGIVLQGFEDSPCNVVKLEGSRDGSVGHVPAILKQQVYYA